MGLSKDQKTSMVRTYSNNILYKETLNHGQHDKQIVFCYKTSKSIQPNHLKTPTGTNTYLLTRSICTC